MAHNAIGSATASSFEASSRKYRVMPCYFHERGTCSKGKDCTFLHSDASEPVVPIGAPPGRADIFRAPRARTVLCRYFEKDQCKLGHNCSFSHDRSNKALERSPSESLCNMDATTRAVGWNFWTVPCRYYAAGKCHKGDDCTFLHILDNMTSGTMEETDALQSETDTKAMAAYVASSDLATDVPTSSSAPSSDDSDDARSEISLRGSSESRLSSRRVETRVNEDLDLRFRRHEYGLSLSRSQRPLRPPPSFPPPPPPCIEEDKALRSVPPWRRTPKATTPVIYKAANVAANDGRAVKVMVWSGHRWESEVWDLEAMAQEVDFES